MWVVDASGTSAGTQNSSPASEGTARFGHRFQYADGLIVRVSEPKRFTPSDTASADKAKAYVAFTVRLINKTGKAFDPNSFFAPVQSGSKEGREVYDSERGLNGAPGTKLLKGRASEFRIAFGVSDPGDSVMEVHPDWNHEAAVFTN